MVGRQRIVDCARCQWPEWQYAFVLWPRRIYINFSYLYHIICAALLIRTTYSMYYIKRDDLSTTRSFPCFFLRRSIYSSSGSKFLNILKDHISSFSFILVNFNLRFLLNRHETISTNFFFSNVNTHFYCKLFSGIMCSNRNLNEFLQVMFIY